MSAQQQETGPTLTDADGQPIETGATLTDRRGWWHTFVRFDGYHIIVIRDGEEAAYRPSAFPGLHIEYPDDEE